LKIYKPARQTIAVKKNRKKAKAKAKKRKNLSIKG